MDIVRRVNWIDILAVILIIRISYGAFREGLSHQIFPLIGAILILIISLHYYTKIGLSVSQYINIPLEISNFLSFLILTVAIGFIFKLLRMVVDRIIKVEWHPLIEWFGGLAIGIIRASVVTSLILMIITLAPLSYLQWSIRERSLTGMYFLRIGAGIYTRVYKFLPIIKTDGTSIDKEELLRNLASDKSIAPKIKQ